MQYNIYEKSLFLHLAFAKSLTVVGHRWIEIWLVQQEPVKNRSIYGQAGCTQVNPSINFGSTNLFDFLHVIAADGYSSNHCVLPAGKALGTPCPAGRTQKQCGRYYHQH